MPVLPEPQATLTRRQREFAAHIRHPTLNPRPVDVDVRRMAVYSELFFNNVEGFLTSSFPVLHRITPTNAWRDLVRDFYASHTCKTPLFTRLAEEFLDYLQYERVTNENDPVFLYELAHYEWVELALTLSDADQQLPSLDPDGDLLSHHPVVSPLAWHFTYRYPVHRITPDYVLDHPPEEPAHLLIYRDRLDKVGFLEINGITLTLLEAIESQPRITGEEALNAIVEALYPLDPVQVRKAGIDLLNDLRRRDILLGTSLAPQA